MEELQAVLKEVLFERAALRSRDPNQFAFGELVGRAEVGRSSRPV